MSAMFISSQPPRRKSDFLRRAAITLSSIACTAITASAKQPPPPSQESQPIPAQPMQQASAQAPPEEQPGNQQIQRKLDEAGNWAITSAPKLGTPQADIHLAREALAQGRTDDAIERADAFIRRYPNDDLIPQAYLVRADALFAQQEYYKSLYDYEAICRLFPGSEAFEHAVEQEFKVAVLFANGTRRKFWGMRIMTAYDEAEELFIRIQERVPGSTLAQRAARSLADFYYDQRNMPLASEMYDIYLKNYPRATDRPQATQRLIFSELATYKGPAFDLSGLEEARGWLDILKNRYPAQAQQIGADAIQQRIKEAQAEKMLLDARWYMSRDDDVSAKFVLNRLLSRYAPTLAGREAYKIMKDHGWIRPESAPNASLGAGPKPGSAPSTPEPGATSQEKR